MLERARKQTKLGRHLEELRLKNNLSYRRAEELTDISHSYIRNVENGIDPRTKKAIYPTPDILEKFAIAYNVSLESLLEAANIIEHEPLHDEMDVQVKEERDKLFRIRLTNLIEQSGLSISEITRKTEIPLERINDLENGTFEPKVEEIQIPLRLLNEREL
ncbi:transcriptional regulator with XRE-family HTH domain [Paenibacillus sp. PastM-3]|uniref:helix-turn-helix domain-containing protein n=1 Tax=Paenibacillus sp. PastM-3 TaxID=2940534 RepID=UPI002474312B|nr:helix-turn-helix transcriptional regulator [Paenibacillus sp. PastM-3]MDH6505593.1 transcriptional regulator with XRE-family HTH domain [Paenibacillus sp. PastM-3]